MDRSRLTRTEVIIVLLTVGLLLMLTFPVYAIGNRVDPMILGMPLSMAWIVFWIAVQFVALVIIYRSEYRGRGD